MGLRDLRDFGVWDCSAVACAESRVWSWGVGSGDWDFVFFPELGRRFLEVPLSCQISSSKGVGFMVQDLRRQLRL